MDLRSVCPWYLSTQWRLAVAILFSFLMARGASAQTVTVYDDALQNGFNDWSYGAPVGVDLASTAYVHGGTKAIALTGNASFNALSLENSTSYSTATYPVLHFYVNGGANSGQGIHLNVYDTDSHVAANAAIDTYIAGGSVASNSWREVTVNLTQAPLSYNGSYVRFDFQTETGVQPTVYLDDITLTQASSPAVSALQVQKDVTVAADGMSADRFIWQDSAGHQRSAALAHNIAPGAAAGPNGSRGGAMHEYTYQLSNGVTRTADVTTFGNGGYGGFGYVVSHSHYYGNFPCLNNDDSPLGFVFGGTWERLFQGRHHAIFRFTQSYPRNCDGTNAPVQRFVPLTIDWVFSTGRDNPLWAITYDVDQIAAPGGQPVPANTYDDDSRAPYGELNIDGDGSTDLHGVAWGDFYKFVSKNAAGTTVTKASPWDWTTPNTVPYVQTWLDGPLSGSNTLDATIGIVQTQTIAQQDAGGGRDKDIGTDITPYWGHASLGSAAGGVAIPNGDDWPYQAIGDDINCNCGLNTARMTWKTQWGFIGQTAYLINNGANQGSAATAPGYPKKSYSTYIVLGQRTNAPVEAQVTQVETIQNLTLTASTGSVVTSGPAGITRADNVTYQPAGYNHVYGALAFNAASNVLDANINVAAGTLKNPMIIVSSYTGGTPVVQLGGTTLTADADYFASVRTSPNELWITLNRSLTGATNHLQITGGAAPVAPTITSAAPSGGTFGTAYNFTVTATGSAPITFSVTTGALPTGLSLSSAGVISGTPSAAGNFTGTITAANGTAPDATQNFSITIAKANQTITFNNPGAQTFSTSAMALSATASSDLTVSFSSSTQSVCTISGTSLTMVMAGTCTINADQGGNANYNAAATVTQSFAINATVPGAPTIGTANPGNAQAVVSFTPPASNGGSAITSYTVTCTPGPVTASGAASPITVGGLTNGTLYTCYATATNAVGPSAQSGTVTVTPAAAAIPPSITSAAPPGGTFGSAYNYTVTATGSAPITFSVTAGALPTGLSLSSGGAISGTPSAAGNFTGTITAANGTAPDATQAFSITIAKAAQTITFNNPGAQMFSTATVALSASATSALAVVFTSSTQGVCTVSGTSLTMVAAGTCTINADQGGNANYNAAATVTQSFAINATVPGAPTIGTATPGNGQAVVSFTAPASNGGSAITSYTVTCTPGPVSVSGGASPITVGGLTNGSSYSCSVVALNSVGAGAPSSPVSVTPNATIAHGDANGDGQINSADVFYLIRFLFAAGPAPGGSADVNGDGLVNVSDLFYLINYVFAGGPAPR